MADAHPIIRTKLQPPVFGPDILPRTRLIERLDNGRYRKLTLISAPAGYGKTILATQWLEEAESSSAWLSLDEHDNEPGIFLSYLIGASRTIFPEIFAETADLLTGLHLPAPLTLATSLANEAAGIPKRCILVLDDYHLIQNQDVHQIVATLIQYLPPHLHLVLTTRQDPPLDIINLRAKNQITEIRLIDLRFNEDETQQYLGQSAGKSFPADLVTELYQRTEGWIVGLRLATLAMRHKTDPDRFLLAFRGTNQYIMSYLLSEVLSQQSQPVQNFLLRTSLLDCFCADLCDFLLNIEGPGHESGCREILAHLQRHNLFILPLDQEGEWFRYHHLLRDLLRNRLGQVVSPKVIKQLHQRASSWLAERDFLEEALDHAFRAADLEQAASVVAQARHDLMNQTQWPRLRRLLRRFPQEYVAQTPDLFLAEAWLFYHQSQYDKIPGVLEQLDMLGDDIILAPGQDYLRGEVAALQSLLSYFAVDRRGAISQANQALTFVPSHIWIVRVFARLILAGAQQMGGEYKEATATIFHSFDEESMHSERLKATVFVTAGTIAWIAADLESLKEYAVQVINLSQTANYSEMLGYGHYFRGMVAYHQNDLSTAEAHFIRVTERPHANYGDSFAASSCGLALTYQAHGREEAALAVVDNAISFFMTTGNVQLLFMMKSFQAELALRQDRLTFASQWANQFDSVPPLSPMYMIYDSHLTLIKVWLAEHTPSSLEKADDLLGKLEAFLESIHNDVFLIETLTLKAAFWHRRGKDREALSMLHKALTLAMPGKFIRIILDLWPFVGDLFYQFEGMNPDQMGYMEKILEALQLSERGQFPLANDGDNGLELLQRLTDREAQVIALLVARQTDREIAQTLQISHHTVRTHTKNIYAKLGVNNRRQAADRARDLGLVFS